MKTPASLMLCALLSSAGCANQQQVEAIRREMSEAQKRITALAQQNEELKAKLSVMEGLASEVAQMKRSHDWEKIVRDFDKVAYLTPASDGYATVRYDLGALTISFANVEPYANGSRVTLMFGNPLSASINGLQAKIEYGAVDENGMPQNEEGKSKDLSLSETLAGGAWTSVPIILEGIPTDKLGFVRIRDVKHSGISLASRK